MLYILTTPHYDGRPDYLLWQDLARACREASIPFQMVSGAQATTVKRAGVCFDNLDYFTFHLSQLQALLQPGLLQDGDVLFISDAWYPGLPIISSYLAMNSLQVRILGSLHADYFFPGDFTAHWGDWARQAASARYAIYDRIFVATRYSAEVIAPYVDPIDKIIVAGEPLPDVPVISLPKEDKVIFPHRLNEDKHPEVFVALAHDFPDVEFVICTPQPLDTRLISPYLSAGLDLPNLRIAFNPSKEGYYRELASAKIVFSAAELETFGVAVIEGILSGCVPLLPARACYPYIYPDLYLYRSYKECCDKLIDFLSNPPPLPNLDHLRPDYNLILKEIDNVQDR